MGVEVDVEAVAVGAQGRLGLSGRVPGERAHDLRALGSRAVDGLSGDVALVQVVLGRGQVPAGQANIDRGQGGVVGIRGGLSRRG